MHHPIRRQDRAMPETEARALLHAGEYGVLATVNKHGQPYATPLSYVVLDNAVYFHCAVTGKKLENLAANPLVCFAVVGATRPVFESSFSTFYESVVVYGKAREVPDQEEKNAALRALTQKYLPAFMDKADSEIDRTRSRTAVYAFEIDGITGKAKRNKPA